MISLWLDDERRPPSPSQSERDWTWVKTAEEAIELLKSGEVAFASLDHDLADIHYIAFFEHVDGTPYRSDFKEKTGMDVVNWMEEHDGWPAEGVRIHTQNHVRGKIMFEVARKHYGRSFQYVYVGHVDGAKEYF